MDACIEKTYSKEYKAVMEGKRISAGGKATVVSEIGE